MADLQSELTALLNRYSADSHANTQDYVLAKFIISSLAASNGVHPIVLLNALRMMENHFAKELVAMAKREVGDNPKLQEQWLDRLTKKYLGENSGDLGIDPNLFN